MRTYNSMHSIADRRSIKVASYNVRGHLGTARIEYHDPNNMSTLTRSP
jgi:predicted DNA-binding protein with PD1-like motif